MLHDPAFWVAIALVVFAALVFKPVSKMATKGLDERAEKIKAELDEAERLRNEAQDLLAQYQRKQRDAQREAEAIIEHAKAEAERLDRDGRARLKETLDRREKLALERISMAEQHAREAFRARAIDVAVLAAQKVLATELSAAQADGLIDNAIGGLSERLH